MRLRRGPRHTRKPSVISISWGAPEDSWSVQSRNAMNSALQDAATLGVTVTVRLVTMAPPTVRPTKNSMWTSRLRVRLRLPAAEQP